MQRLFQTEINEVQAITDWLGNTARKMNGHVVFHENLARLDNNYIFLPAAVKDDLDIAGKASLLQRIEDPWNDQEPEPVRQVLLIPTRD